MLKIIKSLALNLKSLELKHKKGWKIDLQIEWVIQTILFKTNN